jgi:hypothetical protein
MVAVRSTVDLEVQVDHLDKEVKLKEALQVL